MLKDNLQGKVIVIVGHRTLTGRLILKKIFNIYSQIPKLIALELGKDQSLRNKFTNDPYFNEQEQTILNSQLVFASLDNLQQKLNSIGHQSIDILFSLFQPIDFSHQQKMIDYHLINTSKITKALQNIKIHKCIHLSSIYYRDPGYVPQQDQIETSQLSQKFISREEAAAYLKDSFASPIQGWKWSIQYIQKSYQRICDSICILRVPSLGPTITNFQGFTLKFNYFTYLIYQMGTGLIKSIDGNKLNKVDIIPNDYASDLLLLLAIRQSPFKAQTVNLSSSTRNYITLQEFLQIGRQAWEEYGYKLNKISITESQWGRKLKRISQKFPSQMKKRLGTTLDIISWKIEGQRSWLQAQQKLKLISKYRYFLSQQWHCQSIKTIDIYNQLSHEDQLTFSFNVNNINWRTYIRLCVYAIKKHILNHHVEQFKPQSLNLLGRSQHSYFSDIMWALKEGKTAKGQRKDDAIQWVLNSKAVKQAIKMLVQQQMLKLENAPTSYQKAEQQLAKVAQQMCVQMFSDYNMNSIRMFAWFLHKVFGTIYQKVVIDKIAMMKLQAHNEATQGPLIIIPTHRSYIDFLIMSYVFFGNGIKCPHIAAAQDFLNMAVIHILLRKSGAFFIKRNQKKYKQLYKAIMSQYISKLMGNNHYLQFFIQGTRSRTGKMLPPKFGMLSIVANNVAEGRIIDAQILPVTINYEKILQGNSFTYEMMGEAKVKESLSRLIKAVDVLKQNYGRIHLQMCQTISVKQWLNSCQGKYQQKIAKLGDKIVQDLSNRLVISGPAIVSSVVLMNRKGISDDALQQKTSWLCKEISSRGIKITRSQADSSISVNSTLGLLQGILNKSKKDMFQVQVNFDQNSFVKLFTLTYHRNTLSHIFFHQAVVITALTSFGHQNIITKTVTTKQLYEQSSFLWNLLINQFYLPNALTNENKFNQVVDLLVSKQVIKIEQTFVIAVNLSSNYFPFYWSLIWPVVQSYWITCLYLFKLLKNTTPITTLKFLSQIQWFAQSLINERISTHLQAISSDTIKNAVALFTKMKLITNINQDCNGLQTNFVKISVEQPTLRVLLQKIETFLKSSYAKSIKGIFQSGQGSVALDFPFLSKL